MLYCRNGRQQRNRGYSALPRNWEVFRRKQVLFFAIPTIGKAEFDFANSYHFAVCSGHKQGLPGTGLLLQTTDLASTNHLWGGQELGKRGALKIILKPRPWRLHFKISKKILEKINLIDDNH